MLLRLANAAPEWQAGSLGWWRRDLVGACPLGGVCSKCRITTGSLIGPMTQTGSWIRWAAGRGNMVVVAIKYFPMESVNSIDQVGTYQESCPLGVLELRT